ncbi:WXG100 family type VII secretion target [Breznakia blatticola]|uniref:ESAT-6-like protein n=1 Tax=Breznakia blatticola TaxID=1754012 RepID=A0A4R7ZC42_9FIRM|nr:WXG100 family type VII secretion target [Breznakia blatticola]TDW08585.1 WXG100 family type VII secretion target [Breznakia blatticola]
MQIRIEPEMLEEISTNLKNEGQNFEDCIGKMEAQIGRIPDAWAGQAAEAYQGQFAELKPSFEKVRELIADISQQINDVIRASQELDEDIASKLR